MKISETNLVYSDQSVEKLSQLVDKFSELFHLNTKVSDMFYVGVFCKDCTYANYFVQQEIYDCLTVPDELVSAGSTPESRERYVGGIINQIMTGKIQKPEWMVYVEAHAVCDDIGNAPSTFLRLIPKEAKYGRLGDAIIDFLYSVNSMYVAARSW